jgi:Mrp family chromosome partitioning ATPase
MREFIDEARLGYDFVLLDAPSYPVMSDALILAAMADWVLNVVRPQHTTRRLAAENARWLSAGATPYAFVLNDVCA